MKETIILNFFAGPGAGKSIMTAAVFAELKFRGHDVEQCLEFAKDKVWEETDTAFKNQFYIFAKQQYRMFRIAGKVDVIVTDSPLLFPIVYAKDHGMEDPIFKSLILQEFDKYYNVNIFLKRNAPYDPNGRYQDEEGAKLKDDELKALLDENGIEYHEILTSRENVEKTANVIETHLHFIKTAKKAAPKPGTAGHDPEERCQYCGNSEPTEACRNTYPEGCLHQKEQ